jgi:hypothetical protein
MTSVGTVISYPIPAYSNVPIESQFYKPSQFFISDITFGYTTIVTTIEDHNYVIGQEIRLVIPPSFGCRQLNQKTGFVISIPADNEVEININSYGGQPFNTSTASTQPQILAIGDVNSGITNSNGLSSMGTLIPGSFQDISPI